jgi:2,3-bisphosphoglycerate-dependent phosphoglycerate mutase
MNKTAIKFIIFFLAVFFILTSASGASLFAQSGEITFILLRHAEKDASPNANKADVDLSPEGVKRATRFFETVKSYKPEQIFSTVFKRTRATVAPLAQNLDPVYRIQVQHYEHTELEEFAERLLKLDAKTVVVVGHNTTTPALANLLIKQEKYKPLAETEYDKIWIVKIKRNKGKPNKIEDKVITY